VDENWSVYTGWGLKVVAASLAADSSLDASTALGRGIIDEIVSDGWQGFDGGSAG
jgi:hypothetical protein